MSICDLLYPARCHSCQESPHWPMSCRQARDYRQLLTKAAGLIYAGSVTSSVQVTTLKCPRCRYPIEKHMGCPSMYCIMCSSSFCWDCGRAMNDCNRYNPRYNRCTGGANYENHTLDNRKVPHGPVGYFLDNCVARHLNVLKCFPSSKINSYLNSFNVIKDHRIRLPWDLPIKSRAAVKQEAKNTVASSIAFILRAHKVVEYTHVLKGFVDRKKFKKLLRTCNSILSRLEYVLERVEARAMNQTISGVYKSRDAINDLIVRGELVMSELDKITPHLHHVTRHVDSHWITADLDPDHIYRYA